MSFTKQLFQETFTDYPVQNGMNSREQWYEEPTYAKLKY